MPWYNLGLCDYQLGNVSAAREALQEFLRRAPGDPHAAEAESVLRRIDSGETKKLALGAGARAVIPPTTAPAPSGFSELKRYEEALQSFDQGLEHAPTDAELWHDKGSTYVRMRLYEEAVVAFDRAIALDAEHAGAWSDRGKVLGILGRSEEAMDSLARAVLLAPHHPAPWQNKALLEESLGREADALASYCEFLARAQPDLVLQIEHAKARVAVLEARVRAAGAHVGATPPDVGSAADEDPSIR